MTTIGNKIRKIRELKNLKQDYMADKLGISSVTYGKIERDEADVSHERLEQIAKVFELSVVDILGFDEKIVFNIMHTGTHNSNGYNTNYNSFPEEYKKILDEKNQLLMDKIKLLEEKIEYMAKEIRRLSE